MTEQKTTSAPEADPAPKAAPKKAPAMPKIFAALNAVTCEISGIGVGKTAHTGSGSEKGPRFNYRSIDAVLDTLSPILARNNVVICPTHITDLYEAKANTQRLVRIKVHYTVYCTEDGSSISFESFGEGADMNDKAIGKAMSYAYKTAVFQLFCIPVEGTPEPERDLVEPTEPFVQVCPPDLLATFKAYAASGVECFREEWKKLTHEQREMLKPHTAELKDIAAQADADAQPV